VLYLKEIQRSKTTEKDAVALSLMSRVQALRCFGVAANLRSFDINGVGPAASIRSFRPKFPFSGTAALPVWVAADLKLRELTWPPMLKIMDLDKLTNETI
jgi:hypothetical protein